MHQAGYATTSQVHRDTNDMSVQAHHTASAAALEASYSISAAQRGNPPAQPPALCRVRKRARKGV